MTNDDAQVQEPEAITPTRQEGVPLFDRYIVAISLPDGHIAATLASSCDALGLSQNSQSRRIRLDDVLGDEPVRQSQFCIPLTALDVGRFGACLVVASTPGRPVQNVRGGG